MLLQLRLTRTMARKRGRPPKRRPPKYRLGKAHALPGALWERWLQHVLATGPTWLYVALLLTHMVCCRITEILKLKRRDIDFKRGTVFVGPLKRGPAITKHVMKAAMTKLRSLRDKGITKIRPRNKGMWGRVREMDRWQFPAEESDFLFPATRADSHSRHISKNTVCRAIGRIRKTFNPPSHLHVQSELIRSHSGRHRMVNDLKRCGIADGTAMHYARIVDRRTYLGYGALDDTQTGKALQFHLSQKNQCSP